MFECENLEMRYIFEKRKSIEFIYCKEIRIITVLKVGSDEGNVKIIIR